MKKIDACIDCKYYEGYGYGVADCHNTKVAPYRYDYTAGKNISIGGHPNTFRKKKTCKGFEQKPEEPNPKKKFLGLF